MTDENGILGATNDNLNTQAQALPPPDYSGSLSVWRWAGHYIGGRNMSAHELESHLVSAIFPMLSEEAFERLRQMAGGRRARYRRINEEYDNKKTLTSIVGER